MTQAGKTPAAGAQGASLPSDDTLPGVLVRLEPLRREHVAPLTELALQHTEEFRLTSTPTDESQAHAYFSKALRQRADGTGHPVAVVLLESGRVVGMTRLSEVDFGHRRCELGFTWYDPKLFRSGINLDCKFLLLRFAFESLQLHRVQLHTDTRNLRSQRAIEALGARLEGILRRHQVAGDGYVRDTVVYSVTDLDWPLVKLRLTERLSRKLGRAPEWNAAAPRTA